MRFISHNPVETQEIAWKAIEKEAQKFRDGALCVALTGELGAGKTTLVQGVGKKLGIKQFMASPTFLLMREFVLPRAWNGIRKVYHFDWYRLNGAKQIGALGWKEILEDPSNLVLVEWADKFPKLLPEESVYILLGYREKERIMTIT